MTGHASTPANKVLNDTAAGSVARLVDRLLQQDPNAQVKFCICMRNKEVLEFMSVYSDDCGIVWVDLG